MCRLFVLYSTKNNKTLRNISKKAFTCGLLSAESRLNDDGTGASVYTDDGLTTICSFLPAHKFCFTEEYANVLSKTDRVFFLGHTRNATGGKKVDGHHINENAHPFCFGRIIGAHNGVFSYDNELMKGKDLKGADIDSALFFYILAETLGDDKELTTEHVNNTIEQFNSASYTCLVADKQNKNGLYILKGTNGLTAAEFGPYRMLATNADDINEVIKFLRVSALPNLLQYTVEITKIEPNTLQYVNLKTGKIENLGKLKSKHTGVKVFHGAGWQDEDWYNSQVYGGYGVQATLPEPGNVRIKGKLLFELGVLLHITWRELDILFDYLGMEFSEVNAKLVEDLTSYVVVEDFKERQKIWNKIITLLQQRKIVYTKEVYDFLGDNFNNMIFPWVGMSRKKLNYVYKHLPEVLSENSVGG